MTLFLGADISKRSFTLHVRGTHKRKKAITINNNKCGFGTIKKLTGSADRVVLGMEATGIYFIELAYWAREQGFEVYVINPAKVRHHAESLPGVGNKTDPIDAWVIADYVYKNFDELDPWQPRAEFWNQARALSRHRTSLVSERVRITNRIEGSSTRDTKTLESLKRVQEFYEDEIEKVEGELQTLFEENKCMQRQADKLEQIPGVGFKVARLMTVELGDLCKYEQGKDLTALVGLTVKNEKSGTSVDKAEKISRQGNARVRKVLYMAAMSAMKSKAWKPWLERRKAKGKEGKRLVMAVMDKILRIAFGMMRHDTDFDPEIAFSA